MKVNLQDLIAKEEKRNYLDNVINSKQYSQEEFKIQTEVLEFIIKEISNSYNDGKNVDDVKDMVGKYMYYLLVNDVSKPTFNDFFIPRTLEYLYKNKDILNSVVNKFISEHKDLNYVLKKENETSENLDENVEIVVASIMKNLQELKYIKPGKITEIQEKIKNNTLTDEDAKDVFIYVYNFIKEVTEKSREKFCKFIEKNPEKIYKKLVKDMNIIFSVTPALHSNKENNILLSKEAFIRKINEVKSSSVQEKIQINNFLDMPFYGENNSNNILIFLSEFLGSMNSTSVKMIYEKLKKSKKDEKEKDIIIAFIEKKAKLNNHDNLQKKLSNRITKLIELQDNIGCLDRYNDKNNSRLSSLDLQELMITKEELKKALSTGSLSTEIGMALSAFYVNRITKIVPAFLRARFILDKNGVFEKMQGKQQMTLENLQLSEDVIKLNMAEYDGLADLIGRKCTTTKNNGKSVIDADELNKYKPFYEEKYKNYYKDCKNVITTLSHQKFFYVTKDFILSSLIYTMLTNSKNKKRNWGYVVSDKNNDKDKILLGFDIPQLNMPLFVHIDRNYLNYVVNKITNQSQIPVYEGSKDFFVFNKDGRITNQVLYPIKREQRAFLLKSQKTVNSRNAFVNHLKWIQNAELKPEHVNTPGSRFYDLSKRKIFNVAVDKNR